MELVLKQIKPCSRKLWNHDKRTATQILDRSVLSGLYVMPKSLLVELGTNKDHGAAEDIYRSLM